MKNLFSQKYRSFLVRGGRALAFTSLLFVLVSCSHGGKGDTDNSNSKLEVATTCTTSTTTSTTTSSTTSSTTTSTETTMATKITTTETQTIVQESIQVTETEAVYIEPATEFIATPLVAQSETYTNNTLPISDYERTLLRNVVAREYGSDWISVPEKAKVVSVVMNRVNNPQYPNTIEGVLTQPNQFSGYYACNYEWSNVTDSVREAVDYYFEHQDEFGNWTGFWGDGQSNHFY